MSKAGRGSKPGTAAQRSRLQGTRPGKRAGQRVERRDAILAAALDEFSARGFAATRLDDVAQRAGVAKGTIYLYFRDKESLFQELVRAMVFDGISATQLRAFGALIETVLDRLGE